ncbi:SirB1 family protein [Aquariibacter albus]|uniref:Tetratricopeptide repeat protein n=1 Tax=Aquariibacter albus TaxID=2759899 RepID=A0A839HI91_9BURK|nr:transglutaminase-like domain-containing protein [Aquariibacter albus]MBB1160502.1 tetratricopeptide repeat protein [Aquariibacter albus]
MQFVAPTALDYFASLVADDASFALMEAAVAVAQDEEPQLDTQAVLAEIDALTERLQRRLPADSSPIQRLRLLNRYFFQDLGFAGNVNDYYAVDNSYIHRVLAQRSGIPITLALLYIELAGGIGLQARGISFPGHFLIKVKMPQGEVVIDPFSGRSLSREDLDERLAPFKRRRGLVDDMDMPLGLFLQPATPREIVARLLRNLKEIHRSAEDWPRLVQVQDRLVCLLPDEPGERRDRGLARAEMGQDAAAAEDLRSYLAAAPEADDADALRERLRELGPPPLH